MDRYLFFVAPHGSHTLEYTRYITMPFKNRVGSDGVKPVHDRESPNQPFKVYKEKTSPEKKKKLTSSHGKMLVGSRFSFRNGPFSGDMCVFFCEGG